MKFIKTLLLTLTFLLALPQQTNSAEFFSFLKKRASKCLQQNNALISYALAGAACSYGIYKLLSNYNSYYQKANETYQGLKFIWQCKNSDPYEDVKKSAEKQKQSPQIGQSVSTVIESQRALISPGAEGLGLLPQPEPKKEEPKKEPEKKEKAEGDLLLTKNGNDKNNTKVQKRVTFAREVEILGAESKKRAEQAEDIDQESFVAIARNSGADLKMSAEQAYADVKEDADRKMREDNNIYKQVTTEELQQFCDSLQFLSIDPKNNLQKILELSIYWNSYNMRLAITPMHPGTREIWQRKLNQNMSKLRDLFENKENPWRKGQNLVKNIMAGKLIEFNDVKEYLTAVKNLMWYLYALAVQKGQTFEEGTFVIVDNQFRILNFLNSYFKGYDRSGKWSSHFREFDGIYTKGALDILPELRDELYFPPYNLEKRLNKYHVFFGKTGDNRFFIKPESYGLDFKNDIWSALGHLVEWYHSIMAKFSFGADDKGTMRKERVPNEISKLWKELVYKAYNQDVNTPANELPKELIQDLQDGNNHGIAKMLEIISDKAQYKNKNCEDYINKTFRPSLKYDNLLLRKGREVILTEEDILRGIIVNWPTLKN